MATHVISRPSTVPIHHVPAAVGTVVQCACRLPGYVCVLAANTSSATRTCHVGHVLWPTATCLASWRSLLRPGAGNTTPYRAR